MSRIDDLIRQHCPSGVEFRALGEVAANLDRHRKPVTRSRRVQGKYPYYGANGIQDWVDDFLFDGTFLLMGEDGSVTNSDGSPVLTWATGRIWVNNHAHVLIMRDQSMDLRFLYYFLQTVRITDLVTASAQPKLNQASMNRIRVAVPPIEVQREIVRVLDLFRSLEAELEAELEARRQQYAHYRDSLLTFPEGGVRWIPMGDLGEIYRGRRFVKDDYVSLGLPAIHYGELYTEYGTVAYEAVTHVRPELGPMLRFAKPGDVVIAEVGETVEDVGRATAWLGETPVAIHDGCYGFRHSMNPVFVAYCLQTAAFNAEKNRYVARAKLKRLSLSGIKKLRIPVPSRVEQDRIVAILDKFDALVNDLSVGLPAELTARRKQYEYYRDRLLTFEEAA